MQLNYEKIRVIDSHTGGEPTRLVVDGGPDLGSGPLSDRLRRLREQDDWLRTAVVNEPRGSDAMVGALLTKPVDPSAVGRGDFFNNAGYLGMCGHGTIGLQLAGRRRGRERLEAVVISRNGKTQRIACDYLACGFHLVPNTEFAALLGCEMRNGSVGIDEFQQSSRREVFCAGELTGIGGLELSILEGKIAGLSAAGKHTSARRYFRARRKQRKFARCLARTFRLQAALRDLPAAETFVCRCEDVTYGRLKEHASWRAAKL